MSDIDNSMYRLTVQQRDQAWREIQYWQQKCDALLAQIGAMQSAISGMAALQVNPPMKLLTHAESFEAGRVMEREAMVAEAAKQGWAMKNEDPFEDYVRDIADICARRKQ